MRWDEGENDLARMRLAQTVESWHCESVQGGSLSLATVPHDTRYNSLGNGFPMTLIGEMRA